MPHALNSDAETADFKPRVENSRESDRFDVSWNIHVRGALLICFCRVSA